MSVQFIIAAIFISLGMLVFLLSTLGLFKFKYVLNRMHIGAQSDSLGIFFVVVGGCIMCGITFATLKLILILVFFWLTGPVSSHLLANIEVVSQEKEDGDKFMIKDIDNQEGSNV